MALASTYFLSRVIGNRVYSSGGKPIGKIKDLIVETDLIRPKIVAVCLKNKNGIEIVDYSKFKVEKLKGQYIFKCSTIKPFNIDKEKIFYLRKNVLDKQIVDINGRKLVRVNDLKLAVLSTGTYLVAVDVGFEGFLRRLGVAKPLKILFKFLGISFPSNHILWDEVENVNSGHEIKLSKENSNLFKLHPSDLADIIEEMDKNMRFAVFSSLDDEKAADVLEELEPNAQVSLIQHLSVEKAADLLKKMPADEVADILDELNEEAAEELLNEMEDTVSQEIRELMEYSEDSVGSIMTTDYVCFDQNDTVSNVTKELRRSKPEADTIYYLYVVNDKGKLIATISLRDLIISELEDKVHHIMNKSVVYVYDDDDIDSLNEIISKYSLLAVPVVNREKMLMGMVIINDVVHNLLKSNRKKT